MLWIEEKGHVCVKLPLPEPGSLPVGGESDAEDLYPTGPVGLFILDQARKLRTTDPSVVGMEAQKHGFLTHEVRKSEALTLYGRHRVMHYL